MISLLSCVCSMDAATHHSVESLQAWDESTVSHHEVLWQVGREVEKARVGRELEPNPAAPKGHRRLRWLALKEIPEEKVSRAPCDDIDPVCLEDLLSVWASLQMLQYQPTVLVWN